MRRARQTAVIGLWAAAAAFRACGTETNAWPGPVKETNSAGDTRSWTALGPLLFSTPAPAPDTGRASGLRPFYVQTATQDCVKTDILYPLFFFRQYPDYYKWSILQLVNGSGRNADAPDIAGPEDRHFDVWPFYFSRETPDPDETYHAVLPIFGTIKYRLGFSRISWAPFPLFVQTVQEHTQTTYVPWPIVRVVQGTENGFGLWPLFGLTKGPGGVRHEFFVWPLGFDNAVEPPSTAPEGAALTQQFGILPFYMSEIATGSVNRNFVGPFFGYTERTWPSRYSERRYLWPFLVQGHGEVKTVERFAPLYTYSSFEGSDSTWVGWPFWHQTRWVDGDLAQSKTQFFYFLYWSLDQTSVSRPGLASAYKRHLWPLLSVWDNGAGSRQVQFPSPLEVFFPDNPDIRQSWTPLFALFRYDRRPDGESHSSILWNAVTWRRDPSGGLAELHVGPLLALRRPSAGGGRWTILGFDFGAKQSEAARLPK